MVCHVQAMMELLSDSVPNVRLAALGLLPALKQTIRLPEDVQQLVSFEHRRLCSRDHNPWHLISCTAPDSIWHVSPEGSETQPPRNK
jgi:hypothetical protein